jgi:transcriptional regulator with XRE-family HTH domain
MRDERGWSQSFTGEKIGKPQNVVSRLESPTYGKLTVQTLLEIAHGFDVGLLIKFVPFSRLVREYEHLSIGALSAKSVDDKEEAQELEKWAAEEELEPIATQVPATPLRVIKGRGNLTPIQPTLRFLHEVARQDAPSAESLFGKRARPQHTEQAEDAEAEDQPITLAMAASGSGRR